MSKKKSSPKTIECPWCNHIEELSDSKRNEWFTWTSIKNKLVYLCWNCTDKVHSNEIARKNAEEKTSNKNA